MNKISKFFSAEIIPALWARSYPPPLVKKLSGPGFNFFLIEDTSVPHVKNVQQKEIESLLVHSLKIRKHNWLIIIFFFGGGVRVLGPL